MKILSNDFLLLVAGCFTLHDLARAEDTTGDSTKPAKACTLIGIPPPYKTKPSLSYCFRNNVQGACCLTSHDGLIKAGWESFMPEMCMGMFPEFEQLMCIGCHFRQPDVIGENPEDPTKAPQIRLCKTFARALYGADLEGPTTAFDSCGLWVSGD